MIHKLQKLYREATPIQLLVTYYAAATVIAFLLLRLPCFRNTGAETSFLDDLFMAVSTISVTGLTTFPIEQVYNHGGVILLEGLFQVGGFGVTMLSTVALVLAGRRISLHQRQLIQFDMNQPMLSGMVRLVTSVFGLMLTVQLVFGTLFAACFKATGVWKNWSSAFFHGLYVSVSSVTNAGFDVTGTSIIPFRHDYGFLFIVMVLIVIGSIGYPVLIECENWFLYRIGRYRTKRRFRFSLFAKMAVFFAVFFFVAGTVLIFLSEARGELSHQNWFDKLVMAMFYSVSTRNAGLQINDLSDFNTTTLLILSMLMFIGASPSSVGGGVRTTTVGIFILYMFAFIRGHNNINVFHRRIGRDDVQKSIVVVGLSTLLCLGAVLILSLTEDAPLLSIIFEVASAFGTTGLSLGITGHLTTVGRIVIMVLMFIGRIGMLYMLLFFVPKRNRDLSYELPTERIIIG